MKQFFFVLFLMAVVTTSVKGQITRQINFSPIDKDSLNLSLTSGFNLVEDSCAQIIRHVRLNFHTRKFHGRFTDVNKQDPFIIITQGNYTAEGLKDGQFIINNTDGSKLARGSFKNDKFDGHWELFYEDGKPKLICEIKGEECRITDAWAGNGSKIVDNGNGSYIADLSFYCWKGKLVNGKPDGTWKMYAAKDEDKVTIATEHFKKGEFSGGENQTGSYTNVSRINFASSINLPFVTAEKMLVGPSCNFTPSKHTFVNARYKAGITAFNYDIRDALSGYFSHHDLEGVDGDFFIMGDISTEGHIVNLTKGGSYVASLADGVIGIIGRLPRLNPATLDGQPVVEKFKISLEINKNSYSYSFQFIPHMYK